MAIEPELIADYACQVGENPLRHAVEQRLYWIDIPTGGIFRYDPASGRHEQCWSGAPIGGFTIQRDGSLLLFMAGGAVKIWQNGYLTSVIDEIPDELTGRFNDVIADPAGRVFCGTAPAQPLRSRLYRLDTNGTYVKLLDGLEFANGMGFTPDYSAMYLSDSAGRKIYRFDYEQATGAITNQRVFLDVQTGGFPDGMTVDANGYIWSARWDGSCLVRYTPDGVEDHRIAFPVKKVSSVVFGGADYRDMYITTAGGNNKPDEGKLAGGLFRLRLNIQGRPEHLSNVQAPYTAEPTARETR